MTFYLLFYYNVVRIIWGKGGNMLDIVTTNIDKFINSISTSIKNFLPWDFHIRLLLFIIALVIVLGIQQIYENIKVNKEREKMKLN